MRRSVRARSWPTADGRPGIWRSPRRSRRAYKEERNLRRELVDGHPAPLDHRVAVRDPVGERERHLLNRVGARVTKVRAGDGDRVELRHLGCAELDGVGDQPQRRLRRPDPGAARGVLLEDVVLDGAGQLGPRHPLLLRRGHIEGQQDGGRAVDREARADLVQGNAVEQDFRIGQRVDRDPNSAHFLAELRVIGVIPALRGQVECDRQPGAALIQQVAVAAIGLLGRPETRILTERPQLAAIPAREVATGKGIGTRRRRIAAPVGRSVDGLERDARGGLYRLAHQWITYLQKMRMPIPLGGNMHGARSVARVRWRTKARHTAIMRLA